MKKIAVTVFCLLTACFLSVSHTALSQAWTIYNGNELPTDATPAFSAADNSPDAGFVAEVVTDPDSSANKLFKYDHPVIEGKQTYKMSWDIGGGITGTIVARIKGISGSAAIRIAEIDVRNVNTGVGSKFQVGYDDTIRLASPALAAYFPNAIEWHIYRIVMNGADFSLYVDEKPEPVLSGTATTERTDNWFKFGDQSASFSHTGLFDYIIWDVTGAYAPGQGAPLPDTLSKHYFGESSGYKDIASDDIILYPNPSSGEFTLVSRDGWDNAGYAIVNTAGQVIRRGLVEGKTTLIHTTDLADGVYTLVIEKGDRVLHREQFIHRISAD